MKQKKKNKTKQKSSTPSRKTISALLLCLESAHNALEAHKNFNLAEAHLFEYSTAIPYWFVEEHIAKGMVDALRDRNFALLLASIDAEIERLRTEKVKMLRQKIISG